MNIKKYLLPTVGLLGFFYLIKKAVLVNNVVFRLRSAKVDGNILNPVLKTTFDIFNPTDATATVSNITGKVYANGNIYLGDIISYQQITIEKNGTTSIDIIGNLVTSGIVSTISNFINSSNVTFSFVGSAIVDGIALPISIDYKF